MNAIRVPSLNVDTLRRVRSVRLLVLLGVTCAFMLFAASASAVVLSPTCAPLPGNNFQGGDGDQSNSLCMSGSDSAGNSIDWQSLTGINTFGDGDPVNPPGPDTTFNGGNKETDLTNWLINSPMAQVTPNKSNMFAVWEALQNNKFLDLAFTREAQTGDTHLEFELTQHPTADDYVNSLGQAVPCRTNGDLLVSYEVASGGSPPNVDVTIYRWTTATLFPDPNPNGCGATGTFSQFNPNNQDPKLGPVCPVATCAEGAINASDLSDKYLTDPIGNSNFSEGTFGEASLNLPAIFSAVGDSPCTDFGQFSAHSRSSTSIDSQLQDIVGPADILIPVCTIKTTADTDQAVGTGISDVATGSLSYVPSDPSTTNVHFALYKDAACTDLAFSDDQQPTINSDGTYAATSAAYTANRAQTYYWKATFTDSATNVTIAGKCGDMANGNREQSVVNPLQPTVVTNALTDVSIGSDGTVGLHDTATLSNGTPNAQGTLTFHLYSDSNCATEVTGSPVTTQIDGASGQQYTSSPDITVSAAQTYYWRVSYDPGSDVNNGAIPLTACGDQSGDNQEQSVVNPLHPSVTTQLSTDHIDVGGTASDQATLNGATTNASGTITYNVYKTQDCSGNPVFSSGALQFSDGNVPGSGDLGPFTDPGTYQWQAVYDPAGDKNNTGNKSDCGTEAMAVVGLGIEKHADKNLVAVGSQVGFMITVSGSGPAQGVTLNDPLPSGPAGNPLNWSIPEGGVTGDVIPENCSIAPDDTGTQVLTCSAVDLGTGDNKDQVQTYTVHVVSSTSASGPGFTIKNVATAHASNDGTVTDDDSTEAPVEGLHGAGDNTIIVSALSIKKTADATAVDTGNPIGFKVTVTGSGPAYDVTLNDPLPSGPSDNQLNWSVAGAVSGDAHPTCSISGSAGSQALNCSAVNLGGGDDGSTPQSYTVHVVSDTAANGSGFKADNTATASSSNHDDVQSNATEQVFHPAIAIDKTGPATAQAGDKIGYVLTVTNPGDQPLTDPTVKVSDDQCNGDPVTLLSKSGDSSPDTLDPGDVWTYSCSVQTAVGDTAVHNVGNVTGCDDLGGCVSASDTADTTLSQPEQLVLPERIVPGAANLVGPTGCVGRAFNARVRGTKIATVTFVLDGKIVKRVTNKTNASLIQLRVNPKRLKIGVHRLVVNITFQAGSGTKPKTIRLSFQRCARKLAKPRFTG